MLPQTLPGALLVLGSIFLLLGLLLHARGGLQIGPAQLGPVSRSIASFITAVGIVFIGVSFAIYVVVPREDVPPFSPVYETEVAQREQTKQARRQTEQARWETEEAIMTAEAPTRQVEAVISTAIRATFEA